jgi:hypothetical protein
MKTYYLEFRAHVDPLEATGSPIEEKLVRFWVVDRDPDGALRRAHHYLVQNGWQPADLERSPTQVLAPAGDGDEQEVACYEQAQRHGIAMAVVG